MSVRERVGRTGGYVVEAIVDNAGRACVDDCGVVREVAIAEAHAKLVLRACRRARQMSEEAGRRRDESGVDLTTAGRQRKAAV